MDVDLIKEGPILKPSSSKVGTCQGKNSLTLAYQKLHFEISVFEHVWPPHDPHVIPE